jgi:hypothetical protein
MEMQLLMACESAGHDSGFRERVRLTDAGQMRGDLQGGCRLWIASCSLARIPREVFVRGRSRYSGISFFSSYPGNWARDNRFLMDPLPFEDRCPEGRENRAASS